MKFEQAQTYLLNKPQAVEGHPFGSDVKVYKVKNKMFATLAMGKDSDCHWLNLKCDPDEAVMLRDIFASVVPGYHMNKRHWNTIILDCSIPETEIQRMIDNSFLLVVNGMTEIDRQSIQIQM
ncbi:MAG: putative DNA-binding protein (MmcQ/YjbR family) [Alteromonadaceae bacterium]|jgi:predicted DNA-binding protein (MmcQ/YjbR family)